jgi:RNA polymerase sigma-70 factor, ECF subfamily
MVSLEEKKLVNEAVKGDIESFEKLVRLEENKLFAFALTISGGNRSVADEIYQDAVIKAYLNISKFNKKSSFSTWLWRIIKNAYFDYVKNEKRWSGIHIDDIEGFEPSVKDCSELELIKDDRATLIRKLISMLPVPFMEVITLIDLQEMEHDEVSQLTGIDKGVLKVRLHRARLKLAELIEENIEYFE